MRYSEPDLGLMFLIAVKYMKGKGYANMIQRAIQLVDVKDMSVPALSHYTKKFESLGLIKTNYAVDGHYHVKWLSLTPAGERYIQDRLGMFTSCSKVKHENKEAERTKKAS